MNRHLQSPLPRNRPPRRPRTGTPTVTITAALAAALAATLPATAAETHLNGHTFTHPDGFTLELAAPSSLIPRPIAGSFDPQGRLYVTDSSGSNKPPAEQLKDPQSRILRLVDADADGRFDKVTVFADRVMFPQGCLWHEGSVYVAGPPSIWKFTDTDGDGTADKRQEWYQGNVLTGCANDVHGPYLGPEGMLYWTKGAFSRLDLKDGRGRPIQDRCAHIFRARPDGSGMESIMSGGMDNPVEVAFTPDGEPIFISTFLDLSQPGRRDGLGHAVYGSVFGKINDVVDESMVRRTGDLMPVLSQFGPAAACALTRYEGDGFGPDYEDNLFGTLFNLRKVTRHVLRPDGASYTAEDSDFLVSDQIDFRPTDVFQDADGSLLVVDTGGWYKLCCPSSQLAKADVLGGIYRIRRTGATPLPAVRRDEAYARLLQPPAMRTLAGRIKRSAVAALPESAALLRDTLQRHAADAIRDPGSAQLARVAAEGLGRIGDAASVPDLFKALAAAGNRDRFLEHSLIYALIEIADPAATRTFLASPDPILHRAALLVLEQASPGSTLRATDIAPHLNAPDGPLRDTARWIARRHPEWSADLAGHFRRRLTAPQAAAAEKAGWDGLLGIFASRPESQPFLAEVVSTPGFRPESRVAALEAIAGSGVREMPTGWRSAILASLATRPDATPDLHTAALRATRALPFPKSGDPEVTAALRQLAHAETLSATVRIEALASLPAGSAVDATEFAVIRNALEPARLPTERLAAANAAGRLRFNPTQLAELTPALGSAGPLELPRLLPAFASGGDETLGRRLLASLKSSSALRSIRPEDLKPHLAKFPSSIGDAANALLNAVKTDAAQDLGRLDGILAEVQKLEGQIRNGQALFNSTKAACSSCHRLGYLGGRLGPDLTAIGQARTERDLLEAVIFPSASYVRSYEPWIASTRDGEEYAGVLVRDSTDEIVLATGPGAETRIRRSDLTELRLGSLSTMPAGLDEQLSRQDLADLLAFLKNTKWGVN